MAEEKYFIVNPWGTREIEVPSQFFEVLKGIVGRRPGSGIITLHYRNGEMNSIEVNTVSYMTPRQKCETPETKANERTQF